MLGGGAVRTARAQTPCHRDRRARRQSTRSSCERLPTNADCRPRCVAVAVSAIPAGAARAAGGRLVPARSRRPQSRRRRRPAAVADGGAGAEVGAEGRPRSKPHRWVDVQAGTVDARYRLMETSAGVRTANQMQQRETFKAGVKFDRTGRYSLQMGARQRHELRRQLGRHRPRHGRARPALAHAARSMSRRADQRRRRADRRHRGPVRGESTEITSYDNDGFLVGERISVKRPKQRTSTRSRSPSAPRRLNTPNVFRRFDGLDASQLHAGADGEEVRRARVGVRRLDALAGPDDTCTKPSASAQGKPRRRRRAPRVLRTCRRV